MLANVILAFKMEMGFRDAGDMQPVCFVTAPRLIPRVELRGCPWQCRVRTVPIVMTSPCIQGRGSGPNPAPPVQGEPSCRFVCAWEGPEAVRVGRWAKVKGFEGTTALSLVSSSQVQYCDGKGPLQLSYCGDQLWESRGWSVQVQHPVLLGMLPLARQSWTAGHWPQALLQKSAKKHLWTPSFLLDLRKLWLVVW